MSASKIKRKRLERALDDARRVARERVRAMAAQEKASVGSVATNLAAAALAHAAAEADFSARLASSPAARIPQTEAAVAVDAINRSVSALVNALLVPQIALEELCALLPEEAFEVLCRDLAKVDHWKRMPGRPPRPPGPRR